MTKPAMSENEEQTHKSGKAGRVPEAAGQPEREEPPSNEGAAQAEPTAGTPEERLAAAEAEKNEIRDRMLRIAAEFENYKKRVRREQAEAEVKGKESVLRELMEVVDNLERAAAVDETADVKSVRQGVALVLRQFQQKLERLDVRAFEAKGQPFDPRIHDAISQVPTPEVPPGSVLSELQKGYRMGDRLLRPALVVVAVAPPPAEPATQGTASSEPSADGSGQNGTVNDGAGDS
jgi:molecular chaperone GrpE